MGEKSDKIIIGIDPDIDKSGVALMNAETKKLTLFNMRFFELFGYLESLKILKVNLEKVYIEAGWLNQSNWHVTPGDSPKLAANIGKHTGRNHQVGILIAEMCEYLKIDFELVRPTRAKLDAKTFKRIYKYEKRTNQEQRDAAALLPVGYLRN